jgi:hypothetical protein
MVLTVVDVEQGHPHGMIDVKRHEDHPHKVMVVVVVVDVGLDPPHIVVVVGKILNKEALL